MRVWFIVPGTVGECRQVGERYWRAMRYRLCVRPDFDDGFPFLVCAEVLKVLPSRLTRPPFL